MEWPINCGAVEEFAWIPKWDGREWSLKEQACRLPFDAALADIGLAGSRAEAQRLIKASAVKVRDLFCQDPWRRVLPGDPLVDGCLVHIGKPLVAHPVIRRRVGMTMEFWLQFLIAEGVLV